jgi:cation:H+ antiporter
MSSIILFAVGAALLIYSAEKLIGYLVGVARGLRISVFLLAIVFTGIEFDDVILGAVLNLEDLDGVAVGIVFGTGLSMIGIVLALAAIITPSKVNIPRDYLLIFALSPVVMIPFILTPPMTFIHGVILMGLFAAFITYVTVREFRTDRPVFRDAEMYESYALARTAGGTTSVLDRSTTTTGGGDGAGIVSSGASARREFAANIPFATAHERSGWRWLLLSAIALAGVIAGASLTGMGTEGILEDFGLEGTVFGATIATAVLTIEDIFLTVEPARRGAPEIGVANVIGSAVFSVTGKLGIILLLGSLVLDSYVLTWHLPVLILLTWLGAYFLSTGQLRRWHGFVLLGLYICYWAMTFFGLGVVPVEMD